MYPKFIEVHARGEKLEDAVTFVNIAHIIYFHDNLILTPKGFILVSETFEELKEMITDSGCLIKKADPRLNMDHPLTMNDLRTMVGEPVWNSNTGKWGLVKEVREDDVTLVYEAADWVIVGREDLKKFPLCRMKK